MLHIISLKHTVVGYVLLFHVFCQLPRSMDYSRALVIKSPSLVRMHTWVPTCSTHTGGCIDTHMLRAHTHISIHAPERALSLMALLSSPQL